MVRAIAAFRFGIGVALLLPLALILRSAFPRGCDWLGASLLGVMFFAVFFVFYNIALGVSCWHTLGINLMLLPPKLRPGWFIRIGLLLSGAILTETIFSWPGIGLQLYRGIALRDVPLVQGAALVVAASFVVINLLVDLLYSYLDPRIRYG